MNHRKVLEFLGIQSPVWLLPSRLNGLTPRISYEPQEYELVTAVTLGITPAT